MNNDLENKNENKSEERRLDDKAQKKNDKIQKRKDKERQLERDIELMKKEIEQRKQKSSGSNKSGSNSPKKPSTSSIIIVVLIVGAILFFAGSQIFGAADALLTDELSTSEFIQAVEQDRVDNVVYDAGAYNVTGTYYSDTSMGSRVLDAYNQAFESINDVLKENGAANESTELLQTQKIEGFDGAPRKYTATFLGQDSLLELMQKHPNVQYAIKLPSGFGDFLISLVPFIAIAILLFFFFSQMTKMNNQQMGFGKTKSKKGDQERPDVKFSDVAGVDEAVEEMSEVKDFLSNPGKYHKMGAKIPKGCLLVGPPGTGKTLLARAVAGEAGVPFFNISGSDFVEMFVGVGASRVRDLFKQAKECSPSIIFIDEIDAVGRHRGAGLGGGHDEREQTLNQILVEMDGFDKHDSVVLIAATNRVDILDPALLRPGRFDRQIVVDAPDVKGREKILKVHSKGKPIDKTIDLYRVAQLTPGFTGADLANLMNESALLAARKNKTEISQIEISESMERVIAGPERKSRIIDDETKKTISYHESGHALIGHLLPKADPVHKISIISRGRALGYTLSIPKEDKVLNSYKEMMDEICVFMGGRVSEELFCDDITTGASNDLERATKIARSIVTQYGMSAELGTQVFGEPNHEVFLGKDYGNTKDYSEATAQRIDVEVSKIMKLAHDRAVTILKQHEGQMHVMAAVLLERETVEGEACDYLLDNKWNEYLEKEKLDLANKKSNTTNDAVKNNDEKKQEDNKENNISADKDQKLDPENTFTGQFDSFSSDDFPSQPKHSK